MLQSPVLQKKPEWLMTLITLLLVISTSAMLIFFFRHGAPPRMGFAFLVGVILLAPIMLRWQLGWPILFLFIPFFYFLRRFYLIFEGPNPIWSHDLLILLPDAIVALSGIGLLLNRFTQARNTVPLDDQMLRRPLALFLLLCFIEIFNPYLGGLAAGVNGFRSFALWIFLYYITQMVVQRREQINGFLKIVVMTGAITGLYGAFQYMYGFPYYDQLWADITKSSTQVIGESMRAFSTFSFTSTFSHYMVISLCAGIAAVRMKGMPLMIRLMGPFFLGCMLLGLSFTFVRSSFMGFFASMLAIVIVSGTAKGRWTRALVSLAVVGTLVAVVPRGQSEAAYGSEPVSSLVADRVISMSDPTKVGSMQVRFTAWEWTVKTAFKLPAGRGIGAGAASKVGGSGAASVSAYTESQFFSILSELGFPGIFLFLWINFAGFILTIRIHDRLRSRDLRKVATMCLMMQVGLLVTGIAGGTVLMSLPGAAFYWTALGLVTVLPRLDDPEPAPAAEETT